MGQLGRLRPSTSILTSHLDGDNLCPDEDDSDDDLVFACLDHAELLIIIGTEMHVAPRIFSMAVVHSISSLVLKGRTGVYEFTTRSNLLMIY